MEEGKRGGSPQALIVRIVLVVAALGLVAGFFLPWASADAEFRDAVALAPDLVFYEPTGMTVSDATDISLLEYAQVYGSMGEGTAWQIYMIIMYGVLAVSVVTLLLAALGKPVGASIMAVLVLAGSRLLVWDFGDRGVLPNSTHDWGIAPTIYIIAFVILLAAAVWLFVMKRKVKAGVSA